MKCDSFTECDVRFVDYSASYGACTNCLHIAVTYLLVDSMLTERSYGKQTFAEVLCLC